MAGRRRIRWERVALVFIPLFLLLCTQCGGDEKPQESQSDSSAIVDTQSGAENAEQPFQATADFVVVIDAGHGGNDGGCVSDTPLRIEKEDTLRMSEAVCEKLETYPNVQVIATREEDVFVELEERCRIANDANADLFVSIHRNIAEVGNGVEIWVNKETDEVDRQLAEYIMELLEDVGISRNRGIRYGFRGESADESGHSYYVNANTNMPSCLIELGFVNSEEDNTNFDQKFDAYAAAIAQGIMESANHQGMSKP